MTSDLKVRFGKAQNGWLPLEIITINQKLNFTISHTPIDFLTILIEALIAFEKSINQLVVRLNEEPAEYEFVFSNENEEAQLTITRFDGHRRNIKTGEVVIRMVASPKKIILPFWRALRELESRLQVDEFKHHWQYNFPNRLMKNLDKSVALLKNRPQ